MQNIEEIDWNDDNLVVDKDGCLVTERGKETIPPENEASRLITESLDSQREKFVSIEQIEPHGSEYATQLASTIAPDNRLDFTAVNPKDTQQLRDYILVESPEGKALLAPSVENGSQAFFDYFDNRLKIFFGEKENSILFLFSPISRENANTGLLPILREILRIPTKDQDYWRLSFNLSKNFFLDFKPQESRRSLAIKIYRYIPNIFSDEIQEDDEEFRRDMLEIISRYKEVADYLEAKCKQEGSRHERVALVCETRYAAIKALFERDKQNILTRMFKDPAFAWLLWEASIYRNSFVNYNKTSTSKNFHYNKEEYSSDQVIKEKHPIEIVDKINSAFEQEIKTKAEADPIFNKTYYKPYDNRKKSEKRVLRSLKNSDGQKVHVKVFAREGNPNPRKK